MKLSIIIIVSQGQEKSIETQRAVESAQFADEVLVMPFKDPIEDFAKARNESMQKAKGEWVMFLDSDEVIYPELALEIQRVLKNPKSKCPARQSLALQALAGGQISNGYFIKRRDYFLGKWMNHGETAHVKLLRLAKKNAGVWRRPVHEVWQVDGEIGELQHPIFHYSHKIVDEMLEKIDYYSTLESIYRNRKKYYNCSGRKRYNTFFVLELVAFPAGKFIQNYFFRFGFLDGMPGFIHAMMMSFHSFLVRAKEIEISTNKYQ